MPVLERLIGLRGPKFYEVAGDDDSRTLMFVNYMDSNTRDGPRPATEDDSLAHPEAWTAFTKELQGEGADAPFRAMVTFTDPEDGPPPREPSANATRRDAARRRGETA